MQSSKCVCVLSMFPYIDTFSDLTLFLLQVCMQCLTLWPTCQEARVSLDARCQRRRWFLY